MSIQEINLNHFRMKLASVMQKEAVTPGWVGSKMREGLKGSSKKKVRQELSKAESLSEKAYDKLRATKKILPKTRKDSLSDLAKGGPRLTKHREAARQNTNRSAQLDALYNKDMNPTKSLMGRKKAPRKLDK